MLAPIFLPHLGALEGHAGSPVGFAVGGLDGGDSRPLGVGEVAVEEDDSEDGESGEEWKEAVHRSLLLLGGWEDEPRGWPLRGM